MSCGICVLPGILLQVWHSEFLLFSYEGIQNCFNSLHWTTKPVDNGLILSKSNTIWISRVFFHIFVHLGANFCSFSFKGLYEKPSSILWLQHETKTHQFNKKKSKIILCLYRRVCMQCMQTQIVFLLLLWEFWTPTDSISGLKLDQILLRCKGFFKICSHRKY